LKFGDVVMSVATIAVISALIAVPFDMVFVSALGLAEGWPVSGIVTFFLSTLIGGYVFAGKIWEARREAIAKITVLWAALMMLVLGNFPAQADWGPWVKAQYQGQYGTTLSAHDWVAWEGMYLDLVTFLWVVVALVAGFVGLYVGSMLRKPKKS